MSRLAGILQESQRFVPVFRVQVILQETGLILPTCRGVSQDSPSSLTDKSEPQSVRVSLPDDGIESVHQFPMTRAQSLAHLLRLSPHDLLPMTLVETVWGLNRPDALYSSHEQPECQAAVLRQTRCLRPWPDGERLEYLAYTVTSAHNPLNWAPSIRIMLWEVSQTEDELLCRPGEVAMFEARFCPLCGTAMGSQRLGDRTRPVCPGCGWVHYVNPVVAAGTLVDEQGRALLIRRGVEPGAGQWGLPAGYAEAGETPEQTAVRETREEAGLDVALDGMLGTYAFGGEALPSGVLVLYAAHIVGGDPRPGDDATEVRFFAPGELPADLAFDSHRRALAEWARARAIAYGPATAEQAATVARIAGDQGLALSVPATDSPEDSPPSLLVATDGEDVIGFLSATYGSAEGLMRVQQVYVRPSYRRWGIGSRLVNRIRESAVQCGAERLLTQVPADNPGLVMFMRAGFRVCGFLQQGRRSLLFLDLDLPNG